MHLINARDIIKMDTNKVGQLTKFSKTEDICIHNKDKCLFKKSSTNYKISDPQPEVLILNVNWDGLESSHNDILKFVISIPSRIDTNELFECD